MRNTLSYWLGGPSCVSQVSPALFRIAIARPSIAQFILTLGVLRHGPVKVLFFASAASASASLPQPVGPVPASPLPWGGAAVPVFPRGAVPDAPL